MQQARFELTATLVIGDSPTRSVRFVSGEKRKPLDIGRQGSWVVQAEGVAPVHLFLGFDGASVFVSTPPGPIEAWLGQTRLGHAWVKAQIPCELRFGGACIVVSMVDAPQPQPVVEDQPSPSAQRRSFSATMYDPKAIDAVRQAMRVGPSHPPAAGAPYASNPPAPYGSHPPAAGAPYASNPPAPYGSYPPAAGAPYASNPPAPYASNPPPGGDVPVITHRGGVNYGPSHPPRAWSGAPPQQTAPPYGAQPYDDSLPEKVPVKESPFAFWTSASVPKKAIMALFPLVLLAAAYLFLAPEPEAPVQRAHVKAKPANSVVQQNGAQETGPTPQAGAQGAAATPQATVGAIATATPSLPGASASSSPVTKSPAKGPVVAAAPGPAAGPVGKDAGAGKGADRSQDRQALDVVATGAFAQAAVLYDALAASRPDDLAPREAARVLREKAGRAER